MSPSFVGRDTNGTGLAKQLSVAIKAMFGKTKPRFQPLARQLLASLLYHHDFHNEKIHKQSRFCQTTAFYQTTCRKIKGDVKVCYPWQNIEGLWKINFTGLMHILLIFQEFKKQSMLMAQYHKTQMRWLEELFEQHIKNITDIGGGLSLQVLCDSLLRPILEKLGGEKQHHCHHRK